MNRQRAEDCFVPTGSLSAGVEQMAEQKIERVGLAVILDRGGGGATLMKTRLPCSSMTETIWAPAGALMNSVAPIADNTSAVNKIERGVLGRMLIVCVGNWNDLGPRRKSRQFP